MRSWHLGFVHYTWLLVKTSIHCYIVIYSWSRRRTWWRNTLNGLTAAPLFSQICREMCCQDSVCPVLPVTKALAFNQSKSQYVQSWGFSVQFRNWLSLNQFTFYSMGYTILIKYYSWWMIFLLVVWIFAGIVVIWHGLCRNGLLKRHKVIHC